MTSASSDVPGLLVPVRCSASDAILRTRGLGSWEARGGVCPQGGDAKGTVDLPVESLILCNPDGD
jgi:hypothetical protein